MKKVLRLAAFGLAVSCVLCAALGTAAAAGGDKQRERARRALREGEFETAERLYREMVERDARDLPARLGLSYAQLKRRNLRDSYDNAARVVALDPLSPRAHALLGSALLAAGDFAQSVEEFKTAVTLDEREALAIAGLSMINFYENRPAVALAGLRRAVEIAPDEPDFLFNFAQAAARNERYREAADAYELFLRIAPKTDSDRRARIRGLIDFLRYLGSQSNPLYGTSGPARSDVQFELVNSRPLVEVRLNNQKKPFRFVLDTGSGMCVVSTGAADRLGMRPIARGGLARAVGGGGRFEIVYGYLNSIQLGEARVENVPVYIRDFHNTQEQVDGYVGLSVLVRYLASVDYGTNTLTLIRDAARPPAADIAEAASPAASGAAGQRVFELPIRSTSSGFWSSAVQFDGLRRPLNFIVDTGASISVVSQQLTEREDLSAFEQKARLKVFGAAGITENVPLLLVPRVRIGAYTHPHLAAAVLDMAPINETAGFEQTGILGGNVLRFFRVTFDFARGVVRLEMLPGYQPPVTTPREATVTPQGY
ncbi:MAG TPA: aspartyl protease family protein [Pyrinomonadaceae bacterium]|nr:aspartyl protease family protein [Pyrinomonadaceae bacterium]